MGRQLSKQNIRTSTHRHVCASDHSARNALTDWSVATSDMSNATRDGDLTNAIATGATS